MPKKFVKFNNNLEDIVYHGVGPYGIPEIKGETEYKAVEWIGYNFANSCKECKGKGIHFYLDDYQFDRVWTDLDENLSRLSRFDAVLSPDWSMYLDWPVAVNIWSHYRKHYVAARLQDMGVTVYASINWNDEKSFDWCFDGEPRNSIVAVTSVGTQMDKLSKKGFMLGYDAMLERLDPSLILFMGNVPDGCRGNILKLDEFYMRLRGIGKNESGVDLSV